MRAGGRAPGGGIDPAPCREQIAQRRGVVRRAARGALRIDKGEQRAREGRVGLLRQFGR